VELLFCIANFVSVSVRPLSGIPGRSCSGVCYLGPLCPSHFLWLSLCSARVAFFLGIHVHRFFCPSFWCLALLKVSCRCLYFPSILSRSVRYLSWRGRSLSAWLPFPFFSASLWSPRAVLFLFRLRVLFLFLRPFPYSISTVEVFCFRGSVSFFCCFVTSKAPCLRSRLPRAVVFSRVYGNGMWLAHPSWTSECYVFFGPVGCFFVGSSCFVLFLAVS